MKFNKPININNNFKKIIDILAWIAVVIMAMRAVGFFSGKTTLCLDVCKDVTDLLIYPIGLVFVLLATLIKKNFQAAIVLGVVIVMSMNFYLTENDRVNKKSTPPPIPTLNG